MIAYNPKDWFTFIFRFHRADTFRKLTPALIALAFYSALIAYAELEFWKLAETSQVKNISIMHNLLAVVISLLLVFRTNTAYERWWEGRKLWGELVNTSRGLAQKFLAMSKKRIDHQRLHKILINFAMALRDHLQENEFETARYDSKTLQLDFSRHVPEQLSAKLMQLVTEMYRSKRLSGDQFILLGPDMQSLVNIYGACERIKNSPIPYSYSAFIKKFIFFYTITMPFSYAFTLGYFMIPVVLFIFYVLASLELIAEEIEDPFGKDPNDLPMAEIIMRIQSSLKNTLGALR